jgi:site-specific recombinase XerC
MPTAFAAYARSRSRVGPSLLATWNLLCTLLYTSEQLTANPMQLIGRPKLAQPLPKALPQVPSKHSCRPLLGTESPKRQTDWAQRDLALVLTAIVAGLRADELRQCDIGDIRTTDHRGAVTHVKAKGEQRSVPLEAELLSVIETYLESRATRFLVRRKAKRISRSLRCRDGPRDPRFSSAATVNASRVGRWVPRVTAVDDRPKSHAPLTMFGIA